MFYTNSTFIGIDPTAGEKPFVYARWIMSCACWRWDTAILMISGFRGWAATAVVAIVRLDNE